MDSTSISLVDRLRTSKSDADWRQFVTLYAPMIYYAARGQGLCETDAADLVRPSVNGAARAMELALADAGADPGDIDYVNAHGTGTAANDAVEAQVLHRVFGARSAQPAVSSTKAVHGHSLGAAAGLEAVATVLAIHHGTIPPTANFLGADPDCDLDCVIDGPRDFPVRAALSNAFGFGGLNAVLLAKVYPS